MSSVFTSPNVPDKQVPAREDVTLIDDEFSCEYDAPKYTPTNEKIQMKKLPSFRDDGFYTGNASNVIISVSREASKFLTKMLSIFLLTLPFSVNDYKIKLASFVQMQKHLQQKYLQQFRQSPLKIFVCDISVSA